MSEHTGPGVLMILQTLRKATLFSGLPSDQLKRIAQGCQLQAFEKNRFLFHEGEKSDGFYVMHSGAVNVHKVTAEGREQVIRIFYPGESFGEVALTEGHPVSAKAIEYSQVILVPKQFFRQQIHQDPDLALRMIASMGIHLKFLVETVEGLKLRQAESRVAQWLLLQAEGKVVEAGEVVVTIPMAKRLLASQLGISSETLSRVLARLRDEKIISVDRKRICLLAMNKLEDYTLQRYHS